MRIGVKGKLQLLRIALFETNIVCGNTYELSADTLYGTCIYTCSATLEWEHHLHNLPPIWNLFW